MSENNLITINDLYNMSEEEVVKKIEKCDLFNISECFKLWRNASNVKTSSSQVADVYSTNIKAKKRYINPLVQTNNGLFRINEISQGANNSINKCMEYDFDRYLYMDFNFDNKEKAKSLSLSKK